MTKNRAYVIVVVCELVSVILGGGSIPYIVLGYINNFDTTNAKIMLVIAVVLMAIEYYVDPIRVKPIILSTLAKIMVASAVIASSTVIVKILLGRQVVVFEQIILCLTIAIYIVAMLKYFIGKATHRGVASPFFTKRNRQKRGK